MGEMIPASAGCYCNRSDISWLYMTPEYTLSDENKFGSFACTMGVLSTSNIIHQMVSDTLQINYNHVENNIERGNHTCCVTSLPPPTVQGYQWVRCKCKDGYTRDGYANRSSCTSKKIPAHSVFGCIHKHTHTHTFHFLLVILFYDEFLVWFNSHIN